MMSDTIRSAVYGLRRRHDVPWLPLAYEECRTLLTPPWSWVLAGLVVLLGYQPTYAGWDALGPDMTVGFLQFGTIGLYPLGVLLLCYQSITDEQRSGTLKLVLGLPLTRTDILAGKVVGRSVGVALPTCVGVLVLTLIGVVQFGLFSPLAFVGTVLVVLLFIVALVSVATAASAVLATAGWVVKVAVLGIGLVVMLAWRSLTTALHGVLEGVTVGALGLSPTGVVLFFHRLSPNGAFAVATNWALGVGNAAETHRMVISAREPGTYTNALTVGSAFPDGGVPLYLHESLAVLVLVLWCVVPLAVARRRFERGDLV